MLKFYEIQTIVLSFIFQLIPVTFWANKQKTCPNQEGWIILI